MKRFAVGYYSAYDDELTVEVISADNWEQAIHAHSKVGDHEGDSAHPWPASLDDVKQMFFDQDAGIDVIEIPDR